MGAWETAAWLGEKEMAAGVAAAAAGVAAAADMEDCRAGIGITTHLFIDVWYCR